MDFERTGLRQLTRLTQTDASDAVKQPSADALKNSVSIG
jgi:hypothetical protein